jgi:DNA-binding transcriptional LysR family regulator
MPSWQYHFGMSRAVSLRQMRYFIAVAEERHFSRAAERLAITQPPLSRQIAELESTLGTPLLERDTHGVRLTAAGDLALRGFKRLVRDVDHCLAQITAAAATDTVRPLRLGLLNWMDPRGVPALQRELQRKGQAVHLEVSTTTTQAATAALRQGALDAALVGWPAAVQRLRADVVGEVALVAFVPAGSALARRKRVALRELSPLEPFFRFARAGNAAMYDEFSRLFEAHGLQPRQEAPAPDALHVFTQIGT